MSSGTASAAAAPLLETRNLGVRFGGLQALEGVDLAVQAGEIFGLLGPNGAGKTTLFNLISGVTPAGSGAVLWRGGAIHGLDPNRIARLGIARTFQNLRLFQSLSCRDNVLVGLHRQARLPWPDALLGTPRARRHHHHCRSRRRGCWSCWRSARWAISRPPASPTATAAAWRSPGPWPMPRSCCCWMNRPPA